MTTESTFVTQAMLVAVLEEIGDEVRAGSDALWLELVKATDRIKALESELTLLRGVASGHVKRIDGRREVA